jgi:hypothetical protein
VGRRRAGGAGVARLAARAGAARLLAGPARAVRRVCSPGATGPCRAFARPARPARAALARQAHPGPSGRGAAEGGRTPRRTIFGVWRCVPNFPRTGRGRRGASGASVALWGRRVTPIGHGTGARLRGRRTIFDMRRAAPEVVRTRGTRPAAARAHARHPLQPSPADAARSPRNERRSTHVSGNLPAWFGTPPRLPPLARAWAAGHDRGSEPKREAQR